MNFVDRPTHIITGAARFVKRLPSDIRSLAHTLGLIFRHPLNRHRKRHAFLTYLRWQVGSRLASGGVVFNWIRPARLIVRPGMTGATGNIYMGLHEFNDMGFLLHFLREEDLFVDIGANIGSYTVLAAAVGGARVIAFEPISKTFIALQDNIRINDLSAKVRAVHGAVGDTTGQLSMTTDEDCTNHVCASKEDGGPQEQVEIRPLDDYLQSACPSLIKIDVEGFEQNVLLGARLTLNSDKLHAVILELNGSGERYGLRDRDTHALLLSFGFNSFSYDPLQRKLTPLNGAMNHGGNTLYLRHLEAVTERVKAAKLLYVLDDAF